MSLAMLGQYRVDSDSSSANRAASKSHRFSEDPRFRLTAGRGSLSFNALTGVSRFYTRFASLETMRQLRAAHKSGNPLYVRGARITPGGSVEAA